MTNKIEGGNSKRPHHIRLMPHLEAANNNTNNYNSQIRDLSPVPNAIDVTSASDHDQFLLNRVHHHGIDRNFSISDITSQSTSSVLDQQISQPSRLVLSLTFLASISGFMFGYDTGYISSVLVTIGTDLENRFLTTGEKEFITSGTSLGALLGALIAGILADLLGRKTTIVICNILFIVGAGLQFIATKVLIMIAGRLVMGIGVGIGSLIAPLYISELAPGKYRGKLVICNCLAITGGQLIAYAAGAGLASIHSGWRYIIGLSLIPSLIQLVAFIFLPDTPRYLIMKGNLSKAKDVLKMIYVDVSNELIDANVEELLIANTLVPGDNEFEKVKNGLRLLFNSSSNVRALVIGCGLQASQQFVGFNSIMYFSGTIFEMVGYSNSTGVSVIIAGTNFLFTILALLIIDRVGRRNILLFTVPFIFVSQVICAICFHYLDIEVENGELVSESFNHLGSTSGTEFWKYMVIIGLVAYVAFYATGLGNVPWQQSELFPQSVRGLGTSFATATNWSGSMIVSVSFLSMMEILSPTYTFLIFGLITLSAWWFLYLCYPELSGMQLEDVSHLLSDGFHVKESIEIYRNYRSAQLGKYTNISGLSSDGVTSYSVASRERHV